MDDHELEIEERPIGKDEQTEQENLTSLANAALKKVESDRLSISSLVPMSPSQCVSAHSSSKPPSLSLGASFMTKSSQSIGSNELGTVNMGFSMADSLEGCVLEEVEERLQNLPDSLESALIINHTLQTRVTQALQKLQQTLKENKLRQEEILITREETTLVQQCPSIRDGHQYFLRISSFCVPYFKDKSGRQPPRNKEAKFKMNNSYIDLYTTRKRRWLTREQNKLSKIVQNRWYQQLTNEWILEKKEAECKLKNLDALVDSGSAIVKINNENREELLGRIVRCTDQMDILAAISPDAIQIPKNAPIDWIHVAAEAFDGNRTPEECQLMWENLCRPTLDQGIWTEEEDIKIQKMVQVAENGRPNWDLISMSLPTKRSPFQVFQRWVSFIYPTLYPAMWTPKSTAKLIETIDLLKCGSNIPWSQVQQHMNGFNRQQLQSRWRNVDPNSKKGSFTIDDDFILIKGLYKFNLNFQKIAHFMPGRTIEAIKRRFKRAYLPGLSILPWTKSEDQKIITKAVTDTKCGWRDLAKFLKGRSASEVRARYYIIQVWRQLSEGDETPPPLFPVSTTTDPEEIDDLRKEIVKERPGIAKFLNCKPGAKLIKDFCLKPMEIRRNKLREKQECFVKEKLDKATCNRGRKSGETMARKIDWPDMELTDYFLPCRTKKYTLEASLETPDHIDTVKLLSELFHLKIVDIISKEELSILLTLGINEIDIDTANALCVSHNHLPQEKPEFECAACTESNYDDLLSIIPPNYLNVSAFASLTLHQRKLYQMSEKTFIPYKFSEEEVLSLGVNSSSLALRNDGGDNALNLPKNEVSPSKTKKIHITQGVANSANRWKRKHFYGINKKWNTYTRNDNIFRTDKPFPPFTHNNLTTENKLEGESTENIENVPENINNDDLEKRSDELLFQRFMSIFFWPAIAATCRPTETQINTSIEEVQKQLTNKVRKWQRNQPAKEPTKFSGKLPQLGISEQFSLLKVYEQCNKKVGKNRQPIDENVIKSALSESTTENNEKNSKSVKFSIDTIEESTVKVDPKKISKLIDERTHHGFMGPSQKTILSLKRSLVMKKAWEERRKGTIVNRTSRRDKLKYIPRGSRTRNKVRTDIAVPLPTKKNTVKIKEMELVTETTT